MRRWILFFLMIALLCSCQTTELPETLEEKDTSEITVAPLGLTLEVPDSFFVIWRENDCVLEIAEREEPKNRMLIKRMEPFSMEFFSNEPNLSLWGTGSRLRPDYLSSCQNAFTVHEKDGEYWFDYTARTGDVLVEGRQWVVNRQGSLISVIAEARKEQLGKLRQLEIIYRNAEFVKPEDPVANFREELSLTPLGAEAFLELHESMPERLGSVSTSDADIMVRDLSTYWQKVLDHLTLEEWEDAFSYHGAYVKGNRIFYNPYSFYSNYKEYITKTFAEAVDVAYAMTEGKAVNDVESYTSPEEWQEYISRYVMLDAYEQSVPSLPAYVSYLLSDTVRTAHSRYILGMTYPQEAQASYYWYVTQFPESSYVEIVKILATLPPDKEDYIKERTDLYRRLISDESGLEVQLMDDER